MLASSAKRTIIYVAYTYYSVGIADLNLLTGRSADQLPDHVKKTDTVVLHSPRAIDKCRQRVIELSRDISSPEDFIRAYT